MPTVPFPRERGPGLGLRGKAQKPRDECPRVSKRARSQVKGEAGRRWDRRRVLIALVAILIVVTMIASSMAALFHGNV